MEAIKCCPWCGSDKIIGDSETYGTVYCTQSCLGNCVEIPVAAWNSLDRPEPWLDAPDGPGDWLYWDDPRYPAGKGFEIVHLWIDCGAQLVAYAESMAMGAVLADMMPGKWHRLPKKPEVK